MAQLVWRHPCVADRLPVAVRFPAGPRVRLSWQDRASEHKRRSNQIVFFFMWPVTLWNVICYSRPFSVMSKPTKQSMECLRHLCSYLLGCTDQCLMLKYESHQGLLHYNLEDYTLEIYSDSDWAKHRTTRRSVSAGYLFMFGNLLYSSSRSQKALALSSCEAEVYVGTSATSDAVLMYHCICFCVCPNETVKVKLALDNAAGRSFFHRSGVGRIRHISLRVLWMQQKVREKFLSIGPVSTKQNPSDLGTQRSNRDRMLYLMSLCKVYDLSTSQYVGSEVNDKLEQETKKQWHARVSNLSHLQGCTIMMQRLWWGLC